MGKITALMAAIKDKASQSKAALLSNPTTISLHLAVLRATTHSPSAPPDKHHLSALMSLGNSSRATASALVASLMDRLHRTGDSTVALKCLLTIHHVIKHGPFILQDQLSIFPANGGRNYLKLSAFRDGASASTLTLSAWVRFHARYLETLLFASRVVGYFVSTASENLGREEKISTVLNLDLIRDVDSLVVLIEETCKAPDSSLLESNKLVREIMRLLSDDNVSIVDETLARLTELKQRMGCLSFGDSVELALSLKRLEDCTERLPVLFPEQKNSMDDLSSLATELKDKIEMSKVCKEGRQLSFGRKFESARFPARVAKFDQMFQSSPKSSLIHRLFVAIRSPPIHAVCPQPVHTVHSPLPHSLISVHHLVVMKSSPI